MCACMNYRQSGVGREMGRLGLDELTEVKSIQLQLARPHLEDRQKGIER